MSGETIFIVGDNEAVRDSLKLLRATKPGARTYFDKPIDDSELMATIFPCSTMPAHRPRWRRKKFAVRSSASAVTSRL